MSLLEEEQRRKLILIEILNDKLASDRSYIKCYHVDFIREVLESTLDLNSGKYLCGLSDTLTKEYLNDLLIEKYELEHKLIERFNLDEIYISEFNNYAIISNQSNYIEADYYISRIKFTGTESFFNHVLKIDVAKISKKDGYDIKPLIKDNPKDKFYTLKKEDFIEIMNLINKYRNIL
jgi:hypothetical protein